MALFPSEDASNVRSGPDPAGRVAPSPRRPVATAGPGPHAGRPAGSFDAPHRPADAERVLV